MLCHSLTCGTTLAVIFLVSYRFLFFVSSSNVSKGYWIFTVRRQFLC